MTPAEQDIAVRTIAGEARGEKPDAQRAVAHVILNRMRVANEWREKRGDLHPLFGAGDAVSACWTPAQFSCWGKNDPNRKVIMGLRVDDPTYHKCLAALLVAADRTWPDPTGAATHYFTTRAPAGAKTWPPVWAAEMKKTAVIGAHTFYR